jgi:hypothetical protein
MFSSFLVIITKTLLPMYLLGTSALADVPIGVTTLSKNPSTSFSVSVNVPFLSSIFLGMQSLDKSYL